MLRKHSAETFSLTAYAASSEGGVITIEMHKGQSVPVSEFETPGGMKGIVFSYDAENPFQPASVSVIVDGINSEETVQEISELKMENGKIYLLYIIPNDGKPQHTFPYVITEKSAGTVTLFTIAIEQDGSNYTAKIEKVSTNKRKIK